jgi:hypothetical protein
MKIYFCTSEYEKSHGKMPRGRGGWIFAAERNPQSDRMIFTGSNLTLTEAKKEAAAKLTAHNLALGVEADVVELYILP